MGLDTKALEKRLGAIETRLRRVERLAYMNYDDIRRVANYAYENVLLEHDAETIKRMPQMQGLSDNEALAMGMNLIRLVVLKRSAKLVTQQCRKDVLAIAAELADALIPAEVRDEATTRMAA